MNEIISICLVIGLFMPNILIAIGLLTLTVLGIICVIDWLKDRKK